MVRPGAAPVNRRPSRRDIVELIRDAVLATALLASGGWAVWWLVHPIP